jgi:hypothetical protein
MITEKDLQLQRRLNAIDKDIHLAMGSDGSWKDSNYTFSYCYHPKKAKNLYSLQNLSTDEIIEKVKKWLLPQYTPIPKACIDLIDQKIYHGEDKKECKVISILNKEEFLVLYDDLHHNVFIADCYIKE